MTRTKVGGLFQPGEEGSRPYILPLGDVVIRVGNPRVVFREDGIVMREVNVAIRPAPQPRSVS